MTQELQEFIDSEQRTITAPDPLPFPFNRSTFCRFESIEKRIEAVRVLVVNDLLRHESDLSEIAIREMGRTAPLELQRERKISALAIENILNNIERLVKNPETRVTHLSEIEEAAREFEPDAIVLSGTLRDFDYYNPEIISKFGEFIRRTKIPVLGICGGHQLVGLSFGARIVTLDHHEQHERRVGRPYEYQYRFIRIKDASDPIFEGISDDESGIWQDYTREARILRVWQNHGLQLDAVPDGFKLLATAYLCRIQMLVRRAAGQLIYTVQFHLEKSFEDWNKNRTRWEHPNESRDGRIIFENFLREALNHSASN
ncbi:MAG TPA: gamma-glutamyl-gamma-aminobutyrate hydrolase family protein [Pyrinomonadaceae bacterium]|jgi:GMP synthase-like glutamine amidotransferase